MPTAKKHNVNQRSMNVQSRNKSYAAINILWLLMRPDLKFESKDEIRDQRLSWIADFLDLKKLKSTKDLTDGQIGIILDEMKRMTGQSSNSNPEKSALVVESRRDNVVTVDFTKKKVTQIPESSETIHFAGEEQRFTLQKLADYIYGDDTERRDKFLIERKFTPNFKMLTFKKATSLTMILLNMAANKDLKSKGFTKVSRAMSAKHIPIIKKKLRING